MASPQVQRLLYQFLGEPSEDLKCVACREVALEPWQHGECGKLICKQCLTQQGNDNQPCLSCNSQQPQYFKDSRSESSDIKGVLSRRRRCTFGSSIRPWCNILDGH